MSAKFFFYPEPVGNHLVTIDLGEDLAEFYTEIQYTHDSNSTMTGKMHQTTMLNREVVTIVRDRMSGGEDLAHQLTALQNHLDRGYSCAFTADHTKAFVHPISVNPFGGDSSIKCFSNPFRNMFGAHVPQANDYIVIENQPPAMIQEAHKVASTTAFSSLGGGRINLTNNVAFTYPNVAFMRHYRTFPILKRLPEDRGKSIVTNEHGLLWSLEIRLTPDYDTYFAWHPKQEIDIPSPLLQDNVVIGPDLIMNGPPATLDNPPQMMENMEANFEMAQNLPWNNWRNWGN